MIGSGRLVAASRGPGERVFVTVILDVNEIADRVGFPLQQGTQRSPLHGGRDVEPGVVENHRQDVDR